MPRKSKYPNYPGLNHYRDRHGKPRFYVGSVALKSRFGTSEFRAEYERAVLANNIEDAVPRLGALPGSFRAICKAFIQATFAPDPKTATQHERRLRLESMWAEAWKEGDSRVFGDFPANGFQPKHVLALMLRKKKFPHAANHRLTDLKLVFKWAKKHRLMSDNPAADVDKLPVPNTGGFHPWSDLERHQYCAKHPPGTTARDCYELTWNSGQRISDVIKFGSHNLKHDADGDWLAFTQKKTGKHLEIWLPPELQAIAAATTEGVFLRTVRGKRFTRHTIKDRFRVWCDEAGLPHCSSHGLRKAAASFYASQPNTTATELMDHFGFSLRVAETYIKARNQRENNRRMQMRARGLAA